jgi:hypothetical protein
LEVGYIWEAMVILLMGLEDHQEGERTFRRRWWTSRRRQTLEWKWTPKWQKTSKKGWR